MMDVVDWDLDRIDAYCRKMKPDVLVLIRPIKWVSVATTTLHMNGFENFIAGFEN